MKKILLLVGLVSLLFMGCPNELELVAINVKANKVNYTVGESVALSDIEVVATYRDGTSKTVSGYTVTPATFSEAGNVTVTVSYSENGVTKTASYEVSVTQTGESSSQSSTPTVGSNITIAEVEFPKTSEVAVIAKGTTATVSKADDSSWSSYYSGTNSYFKGVFIKDRTVKLSAFAMSKYEVTQQLYNAVMGTNPSGFKSNPNGEEKQELRPVKNVTWYDAVAFCNKLTQTIGIKDASGNIDYAYYSDESFITPYENGNSIYYKKASKGYRLPTEAEWEFTARGADATNQAWGYAYAGVQTKKEPANFASSPYTDDELAPFGWYYNNSEDMTHEVGLKQPNSLSIYDMSGNVWEWCWDWYNDDCTISDASYKVESAVVDPTGALGPASYRVLRGGSYDNYACDCAVSGRYYDTPDDCSDFIGFRLCRSL